MIEYYELAYQAKPQIEAHTGRLWSPMTIEEYERFVKTEKFGRPPDEGTTEYLAYLRHHGFPSPLLDWTQSPYIATYFAFASARDTNADVAIYAYIEHAGYGKGTTSDVPAIHNIGSYIRAPRRHFLQQSEYTYCTCLVDGRWEYAKHAAASTEGRKEPQDLVLRLTLPGSLRSAALTQLDRFNLNAFSLMGSEESLMETVAFRTFSSGV